MIRGVTLNCSTAYVAIYVSVLVSLSLLVSVFPFINEGFMGSITGAMKITPGAKIFEDPHYRETKK